MQQSTIVNLCLKSADLILFFLVVIYGSFRKALFDCFKGNFKLKLLLKTAVSKNSINVSSKEPCSPFSCQFSFFTHSNENSIGFLVSFTAWVSVFEVFLFRIFSYLDWIRRDTEYLYTFSPNTGKYRPGPEKLRIRALFMQWLLYLYCSLEYFWQKKEMNSTQNWKPQ